MTDNGENRMTQGANTLPVTNEDTCGPYFPASLLDPSLQDLTRLHPGLCVGAGGPHIILRGRVLDRHGQPANGVLMEFWQANAKGVLDHPANAGHPDLDPWFHGYGRLRSATGDYAFRTIMPGPLPGRAPHITVTLFSDGISRIVTQVFLAGAEGLDRDPLLLSLPAGERPRLITRPDGQTADGAQVHLFDIVMAGPDETPFFDDLLT